jgi:hypothetical protein
MRGLGALRIDVPRVKNECDTKRAQNGSIVDAGNSLQTR